MTAETVFMRSILRLQPHRIVLMCCCTDLNHTHLLTYCSAQLTRTVNPMHRFQYIGFSISLCVMCNLQLLVQFAP